MLRPLIFLLALGLPVLTACGGKDDTAGDQSAYEGDEAGECTDGADNDQDGQFDCDDEGCNGSPDCDEADTDTDADSDSDTDADSDADADADSDADTDADSDVECIPCEGNFAITNGFDLAEAAQCASISGYVYVTGQDWVTDVELPCLTSVGGRLYIVDNEALSSLDGLATLESVGGDLEIGQNPLLESVEGLGSLTDVGEDVLIDGNDLLPTLAGLASLQTVGGFVQVLNNPLLGEIGGLPSLESVGLSMNLYCNNALTTADLLSIETVAGDLYISENDALVTLTMPSLVSVGLDLTVTYNDSLCQADAEAFADPVTVADSTWIYGNNGDCD